MSSLPIRVDQAVTKRLRGDRKEGWEGRLEVGGEGEREPECELH